MCVCDVGSFINEVYVYSKPSSGAGVGVGKWPLQPVANELLLWQRMAVGVFIRSDKVLLKGRDPLFSRVRQTFYQRLLSSSQAFAAYLLSALPQHHLPGAAGGRVVRLSPRPPVIEKLGPCVGSPLQQ